MRQRAPYTTPGVPVSTDPPRRRPFAQTFRSLGHRDYRLWAGAAVVSNTGTWMQRVAQDWLVLVDLTADSALAVGVVTGLQFLPMVLLAPWAGLIADRFEKRRILQVSQTLQGLLALGLGLLVLAGAAQVWHVYVFALALGVVTAFDAPARQTYVTSLVPAEDLPNAIGLNAATFHLGRLLGPASAGLLIAWVGTGPVFVINAVSFAFTVVVLAITRTRSPGQGTQGLSGLERMRQAVQYVRTRGDILLVLVLVFVVGTFGLNFQLTTAVMARIEFGRGPESYGLLGTFLAVGSLTGALVAAGRRRARLRLVVGAVTAFGVASSAAALMPTYWTFAASLVLVGLASLTLMTAANATVQLSTPPELRGRVMALYFAVFIGATPVGAPLIGWIAEAWGARWTIAVGGITALLAAAGAVVFLLQRSRVELRFRSDARPHVLLLTAPKDDDTTHPTHDERVA
ncbi:MFS transporter [Aquipuribacter sp. SD81]|uniref:MFS transporter n=1 Tax=Aquipuribacter sp. SD81 TaxID=3127703 RepID=UPI00301B277B